MAVRGITRATDTVALRPSPPRSRCFSTHRAEASVVPAASSAAASETEGVPVWRRTVSDGWGTTTSASWVAG